MSKLPYDENLGHKFKKVPGGTIHHGEPWETKVCINCGFRIYGQWRGGMNSLFFDYDGKEMSVTCHVDTEVKLEL